MVRFLFSDMSKKRLTNYNMDPSGSLFLYGLTTGKYYNWQRFIVEKMSSMMISYKYFIWVYLIGWLKLAHMICLLIFFFISFVSGKILFDNIP